MFIEPTVLSFLIAKLRGGKINNLENVYIKGWYLIIIAAIIQGGLSYAKALNITSLNNITSRYLLFFMTISYILMGITILLNFNKKYMKLFFIGLLLNFIVIAGNNGQMPVSLDGLDGVGVETSLPEREFDIKHIAVNSKTRFVYLADIILIPRPYPLPKILSIGDIILMLGTFVLFQEEMVLHKKKKTSR